MQLGTGCSCSGVIIHGDRNKLPLGIRLRSGTKRPLRRVIPAINEGVTFDKQANTIIGHRVEGIGARAGDFYVARPAGGKIIGRGQGRKRGIGFIDAIAVRGG